MTHNQELDYAQQELKRILNTYGDQLTPEVVKELKALRTRLKTASGKDAVKYPRK